MRVKLLIATGDADYAGHLSDNISEHHADALDVCVCRTPERFEELLSTQRFDAALLEAPFLEDIGSKSIQLPLLLWSENDDGGDTACDFKKIPKYQQVSSIVASVLENYARVSKNRHGSDSQHARVIAVWSPAGGVGKTTVALAYAAKRAAECRQVLYLNLEPFSSVPAYFAETGKSISSVFEMLDNDEGNIKMLIRGIRCLDSGVAYLCSPDNFDDMYILSADNISELIDSCSGVTDELVIDMSCVCDRRTRKVFDLANKVLLVTEPTKTAQIKLSQFASQHNVYERIREKSVLVANKGAAADTSLSDAVIHLPYVHSTDVSAVYKTLSASSFEELAQ